MDKLKEIDFKEVEASIIKRFDVFTQNGCKSGAKALLLWVDINTVDKDVVVGVMPIMKNKSILSYNTYCDGFYDPWLVTSFNTKEKRVRMLLDPNEDILPSVAISDFMTVAKNV